MRQNRFGLIVRRMAHDDARGAAFSHQALEERVPKAAGRVLEIPFVAGRRRLHVLAANDAFEPKVACQVRYKLRVRIRFRAAEPVVKMNDDQSDPERVTQAFE
jgi:hypothetical protein